MNGRDTRERKKLFDSCQIMKQRVMQIVRDREKKRERDARERKKLFDSCQIMKQRVRRTEKESNRESDY